MNAVSQLRVARILADLRKSVSDIERKIESLERIVTGKPSELDIWGSGGTGWGYDANGSKVRAYTISIAKPR